jgi:hypothetical protein
VIKIKMKTELEKQKTNANSEEKILIRTQSCCFENVILKDKSKLFK